MARELYIPTCSHLLTLSQVTFHGRPREGKLKQWTVNVAIIFQALWPTRPRYHNCFQTESFKHFERWNPESSFQPDFRDHRVQSTDIRTQNKIIFISFRRISCIGISIQKPILGYSETYPGRYRWNPIGVWCWPQYGKRYAHAWHHQKFGGSFCSEWFSNVIVNLVNFGFCSDFNLTFLCMTVSAIQSIQSHVIQYTRIFSIFSERSATCL